MLLAKQGNKCTAKRSTGSESGASWVLVPRRSRNKNRGDIQCTFVLEHHGAEGPSVLVVFTVAPSEREGFYTSSVAA